LNEAGATRLFLVELGGTLGFGQGRGGEHHFQLAEVNLGCGEFVGGDIELVAYLPKHARVPHAQPDVGVLKELDTASIQGLFFHVGTPPVFSRSEGLNYLTAEHSGNRQDGGVFFSLSMIEAFHAKIRFSGPKKAPLSAGLFQWEQPSQACFILIC
jgi:hypothetical protein